MLGLISAPKDSLPDRPTGHDASAANGVLAMWLFLASLGMFFAAVIVLFTITRQVALQSGKWPTERVTDLLPAGLWISTALIVLISLAAHWAYYSVRRNDRRSLSIAMVATTLLGGAFLVSQWSNWQALLGRNALMSHNMFFWMFYSCTAIHFVHVLGGLVPSAVVAVRSLLGCYSAHHYGGVLYCSMYWHFVDAVWIVMVLGLFLPR